MFLKNQKGMALVPVLFVVTLAALFGTAVYYASNMEAMASENDKNQTQAYYFARSGVELAIGLIKSGQCDEMKPNDEKEFYGKLDGSFSEDETDDYNIKFIISLDNNDYFIINSVGIVRQGATEVQNDLEFKISRADIFGDNYNGNGGEGIMALFANRTLNIESSARINGNVATNADSPGSVQFKHEGYIINGSLYIGPDANPESVVTFQGWQRGPETNIPDGEIHNLPTARNYPLPAFPESPSNLPQKGNLTTNPGNISGLVHDSNGNGIGEVTILLSPAIPGSSVKTSLTTIKNISGRGSWTAYTGNGQGHQEGTVIVTPAMNGYTFDPPFQVVTGPASNINFEAIPDPSVVLQPVSTNPDQSWCWVINEDGYYDTISITGNRTLCIDLQGETRTLRVNRLNIQQGNLVLVGSGKLVLYVEDYFDIGGSSQVNHGGDHESLVMFFRGNQALDFGGSTKFVGSIFAQNADISLSGSNNIEGHIITGGDSVSVSGAADANPRILYAPNADLQVTGSGTIKGTAVVNNCTVSGGNRNAIEAYSPLDTTFFNSLDWGADGPPSLFLSEMTSGRTWRDRGFWVKS